VGRSAFRRRQAFGGPFGRTAKAVGCQTVRATQTVAWPSGRSQTPRWRSGQEEI